MHSVVRCDFLNAFLTLDRFHRDSCLHFRAEASSLPRFHSYSVRGSRFYTLFTGPNFGEQLMSLAAKNNQDWAHNEDHGMPPRYRLSSVGECMHSSINALARYVGNG